LSGRGFAQGSDLHELRSPRRKVPEYSDLVQSRSYSTLQAIDEHARQTPIEDLGRRRLRRANRWVLIYDYWRDARVEIEAALEERCDLDEVGA
jgi:hypothetical protein